MNRDIAKNSGLNEPGNDKEKMELVTMEELEGLPEPVARWLQRSGVPGTPHVHQLWLSQESRMRMSPEKETWYNAVSEQVFNADDPAFTWQVKMKMGPLMTVRGKDVFEAGAGRMTMKLFSLIPVVNAKGPKIDEGTIQRFLGEIAWFPSAALKPYIVWEEVDALTARATIESHGTRGEGLFHFNEEGDFVKFSAMRFKGNEEGAKRYEWVITVQEYSVYEGIRVPSVMNATWKLEEGDWTWLEMKILDIKYNV